ncbi:MAG: FAD-binding oxidoreductase, partial [Limisphaerales bacterium]
MSRAIQWLKPLRNLIGSDQVISDPRRLAAYAGDKWFATHQPDAVALPRDSRSVSRIMAFANRRKIPVTARGAGYGYVGGAVPMSAGIVLSLERMNQILEIDEKDFVAVVQP